MFELSNERGRFPSVEVPRRLPCIDGAELARIETTLGTLRSRWIKCGDAFWALGAAVHLEHGRHGHTGHYGESVAAFRGLLEEHFGWLYRRVVSALAEHFDAPFALGEGTGIPGFNIWTCGESSEASAAGEPLRGVSAPHFDAQFSVLDWSRYAAIDWADTMTLTLAVRLPRVGGNLYLYDSYAYPPERPCREPPQVRPWRYVARPAAAEPTLFPYTLGELCVHNGLRLHAFEPWAMRDTRDDRITLQGHAFRADGTWWLYW